MPTLLEEYSKASGAKIRRHKPQESFYPIPEKYITIQNSSGMPAKDYDYWVDVIEYIHKPLKKYGYEIIQIGQGDIQQLPNTHSLVNCLNLKQVNYVLRNSSLHVGNDSFAVHLSDLHSTPIVALYGSTSAINHGPYFREGKVKLIESHRNGNNPSFAAQESPKTINLIKPEEIANAIFDILDLPEKITEKTLFTGNKYGNYFIEVIPNTIVNPESLMGQVPVLRCDYEYNEEFLIKNLQLSTYSIITDKNTPLEIYKQFRPRIQNINYKVSLDSDLNYIRKLRNVGMEVRFWTDEEDLIDEIRFKMLDIDLVHLVGYDKIDIKIPKKAKYKSSKILLSDGKIFPSKAAYLAGKNLESPQNTLLEIDEVNETFLKEIEYFKIILDRKKKV